MQESDFLEEHEQAEMIEALERSEARQQFAAKAALSLLGAVLTGLYLAVAAHQTLWPWQAVPHARLVASQLSVYAVVAGELGGAATMALVTAATACYRPPGRRSGGPGAWPMLLALAAVGAALQAAFWGVAVARTIRLEHSSLVGGWGTWVGMVGENDHAASIPPTPSALPGLQGRAWKLLWLPLAPPVVVELYALAVGMLSGTAADVARLRSATYHYKRV